MHAEPTPDPATRVTELLLAIDSGVDGARSRLFELLYDELRKVARGQIASGPANATIQATALVNEAYLRLAGKAGLGRERRHFFFAAARAMRDVLVEEARRRSAQRRGNEWQRSPLDPGELSLSTPEDQLLALDEALERLAQEDPRRADVVRLRFFAGLSEDEAAEALQVSKRTISREWALARARLALLLSPPDEG
jgi:RNA polymerase sigma factor (TIGR02999 family)